MEWITEHAKAVLIFITAIFSAGILWHETQQSIADATDAADRANAVAERAQEATHAQSRDIDAIKNDVREVKYKQRKQDWMTYRILEKVDPAAARMIPEPLNPQ